MSLKIFLPRNGHSIVSYARSALFVSRPGRIHLCAPRAQRRSVYGGQLRLSSSLALEHQSSSTPRNDVALSSAPVFDEFMNNLTAAVRTHSAKKARFLCWDYLTGQARTTVFVISPSAQTDCKKTITSAIELLFTDPRSDDLELIGRMLRYMHVYWDLKVDTSIHDEVIRGLLTKAELTSAANWLRDMPSKAGGCTPTREQWHLYFEECRQRGNAKLIESSFDTMRRHGWQPDAQTYMILFQALFQQPGAFPRYSKVRQIVDDMRGGGHKFTQEMLDTIVAAYARVGSLSLIAKVTLLYNDEHAAQRTRPPPEKAAAPTVDRNMMLSVAADDIHQAAKLLETYVQTGFQPTPETLAAVTQSSKKVSDVVFWEERMGLKADASVWTTVIKNAAENSSERKHAIEAYKVAGRRGIPRTINMLYPLLRAICTARTHAPADPAIDQALEYLDDFLHNSDETEHRRSLPIYNLLLRAVTMSPNRRKYMPIAVSLLEDMQQRNIDRNPTTMTAIITMLINTSQNASEAYDVYSRYSKNRDGSDALDAKGYTAVLNAFGKLVFPAGGRMALNNYFNILKDMREAGHPISPRIYTILLRSLTVVASDLPPDDVAAREQLTAIIQKTHDVITLDGSLVPDMALWNQLMDTYQRVGCFSEAYRLWHTMFLSGEFDNTTISIVFDACAFAREYDIAVEIYNKVHSSGFTFNLRNWNNWLECLCRLGKLDIAMKMLCLEMPRQYSTQPNRASAQIVLKFAMQTNEESEVRTRIKRYLPDLWNELQNSKSTTRIQYEEPLPNK